MQLQSLDQYPERINKLWYGIQTYVILLYTSVSKWKYVLFLKKRENAKTHNPKDTMHYLQTVNGDRIKVENHGFFDIHDTRFDCEAHE